MKNTIRQYKVETENGNVNINVRHAVFGAWVTATPEVKNPLTQHNIRPVQWIADVAEIGNLV